MTRAVIEDWDGFIAYLAAQPLCQWSAQKQREIASGKHKTQSPIHSPPPKDIPPPKANNDNAELAAALSSMA
jgi:hypothetical protein